MRSSNILRLLRGLLVSSVFIVGCDDETHVADSGVDAADVVSDTAADVTADAADVQSDTAADVQSDVQRDVAADTATDVQTDTATDVQTDVQTDVATDVQTDTATDVQTDGGGLAAACVASGGTIGSTLCCTSASDFPNQCAIGGCSCAPMFSRTIMTCVCPTGQCFNGTACTAR